MVPLEKHVNLADYCAWFISDLRAVKWQVLKTKDTTKVVGFYLG